MTDQQTMLVRASWARLRARSAEFAELCYEELFAAEPQLRILFAGFMDDQHQKLGDTISAAVDGLNDPVGLDRALGALGERHRGYGVKEHHHDAIARAIMATLGHMLDADFTPDVKEAWTAFYAQIMRGMRIGEHPASTS